MNRHNLPLSRCVANEYGGWIKAAIQFRVQTNISLKAGLNLEVTEGLNAEFQWFTEYHKQLYLFVELPVYLMNTIIDKHADYT